MRSFLLFLFVLLLTSNLSGQTIQVLNAKTGQVVEGVVLFSENFSTQTDSMGTAKIGNFADNERIIFKHSSFLLFTSTKNKISKQGNIVLLINDPVNLDEIVVSVNRWQQSTSEIPHTIKTIQPDEVLHYNPQTTADLLGTIGGIFIQKSQMGGGSPMIRGFSANRILIVVDGIRMNNAIYRNGNLHNIISLDANSLENTEVIFGPGSVIYGSDALGGVMSFNTLKPKLSTNGGFERNGKIFSRYSSANFEKTISASYNFGNKKWAGLISTTFTDFDDLRMGANGPNDYLRNEYVVWQKFTGSDKVVQNNNPLVQKYTGYKQLNLLGKFRFRPNDNIDFIVSAHHSKTGNNPRYDRLIQKSNDKLRYAEWYYGPQSWSMISGQFQYDKEHLLFNKLNILAGFQEYAESRYDRKVNNSALFSRTENLDIFSLNVDFGKEFDGKNALYYGIEAFTNKVNSEGNSKDLLTQENTDIASRYPDGSVYQSLAGYYSFEYRFSERFIFQAGSRFTYTHMKGEFDKDFYNFPVDNFNLHNSAFNGNLGMVWHPTKSWQINIHSSTGFRSPNIDDVAKVFDSEPGNVLVPNPDLKPEYARSLELSLIRSYSSKARIEITGFYTWLKNAMVRRDYQMNGQDSILYDGMMSKVSALMNAESATIIGTTLNVEYLFNHVFRTKNHITIAGGKDSDNYPLRHVPPTFGSSHLIYENQKLKIDVYADYSGQLSYEKLAPSEQSKPDIYLADNKGNPYSPAWWTLNLKSSYQMNRRVTLGGGLENILDKRYRTYSSGMVSAGTNFVFSVLARF